MYITAFGSWPKQIAFNDPDMMYMHICIAMFLPIDPVPMYLFSIDPVSVHNFHHRLPGVAALLPIYPASRHTLDYWSCSVNGVTRMGVGGGGVCPCAYRCTTVLWWCLRMTVSDSHPASLDILYIVYYSNDITTIPEYCLVATDVKPGHACMMIVW